MAKRVRIEDRVENRTRELGTHLLARLQQRGVSIFEGRWWEDRLLRWALADESIRIQMLRFTEALPVLHDHYSVSEYLEQVYEELQERLPAVVRLGLKLSSNHILSLALAFNARTTASKLAKRFIAGETAEEIASRVEHLRENRFASCLCLSPPPSLTTGDGDRLLAMAEERLAELAPRFDAWSEVEQLDQNAAGSIPRLHISVPGSALAGRFSEVRIAATKSDLAERLRALLRAASAAFAHIHLQEEAAHRQSVVQSVLLDVLCEDEFASFSDISLSFAANGPDVETELKSLQKWAKKRGTAIGVRLSKGRFCEHDQNVAASRRELGTVLADKGAVDQSFEKVARFVCKNHDWLRPTFETEHARSVAHALAWVEEYKVPASQVEFAMAMGTGEDLGQLLIEQGYRVRLDMPVGELVPTASRLSAYFLENRSGLLPLQRLFHDLPSADEFLMPPTAAEEPTTETAFVNEPLTDFTTDEAQQAMQEALANARDEFGHTYPLVIGGKSSESRSSLSSRNPSNKTEVVGHVSAATADQAADAVEEARRSLATWPTSEASNRCEYLELIAAELRERRMEMAAWVCLEIGWTWAQADAEIANAIDACMYYAAEARRLEDESFDVSGETNRYSYRPRGVVAIVSPWTSPAAWLLNATAAAIVVGNTVVMKPASEAAVVAAKLIEIIRNAGLPDGVINFVPGSGKDVGAALVNSPDVDMVVFGGTQEVGHEVNQRAAETSERQSSIRRVLTDMNSRNAIIVDADADLDLAVSGIISSAFAAGGQDNHACSRVIAVKKVYDALVERLVEVAGELTVGPAEDPNSDIGPLIGDAPRKALQALIKSIDEEMGENLAYAGSTKIPVKQGSFVGPQIVTGVEPESNLFEPTLAGPLLTVTKVNSIDDAFNLLKDGPKSLAVAVYGRSPKTLKRAPLEVPAATIFLNRPTTGTAIGRQPAGGSGLTGSGIKRGGPDYLRQFVVPICVSENVTRKG